MSAEPTDLRMAQKPSPATRPLRPVEKQAFLPENLPAGANNQVSESVGKSRRILVVDDNSVVRRAFETLLKTDGFEVFTSATGGNVTSKAKEVGAELIILDLNFPTEGSAQWTGFTIMQWLRRFPESAQIPVMVVSGSDAATYRDKALAEGAVAYFQKPVKYQDLLTAILHALDR